MILSTSGHKGNRLEVPDQYCSLPDSYGMISVSFNGELILKAWPSVGSYETYFPYNNRLLLINFEHKKYGILYESHFNEEYVEQLQDINCRFWQNWGEY